MSGFTAALMTPALSLAGSSITWLELLAAALGVWMVLCNLRVDPLAWPLAIASSALYALLFAHSRLYGMAALQGLFIAVALWGWWQWLRGIEASGQPLQVRWLRPSQRWLAITGTLAAWPLLGGLLAATTDSPAPYLDALPTAGSVVAQLLLARKRVDNWPAWVAVNLVSIALFVSQGLWLTVVLYAVFAVLALAGWRRWAALAERADESSSGQPGAAPAAQHG